MKHHAHGLAVGLVLLMGGSVALEALGQDRERPARRRGGPPQISREYKVIEVENGGAIEGTILFRQDPPSPERIAIVKDHETCENHPPQRDRVKVNDDHQVAEAIVFLNISEGRAPSKKEGRSKVDQKFCAFNPRVQVLHVDEAFEILNSDPVLHNIQATLDMRTVFNHVQPRQGMRQEEKFNNVGLVRLACQAHNWMQAFIYVLPHPYHAVTGEDGAFRLTDVPPGEYELHVWQEHLGQQVFEVKVEAGQTTKKEIEIEEQTRRRR